MCLNFKFWRGYGECQLIQSIAMCCYSNTGSADVLLQQQQRRIVLSTIVRSIGRNV
jgi:hypothetical protein